MLTLMRAKVVFVHIGPHLQPDIQMMCGYEEEHPRYCEHMTTPTVWLKVPCFKYEIAVSGGAIDL